MSALSIHALDRRGRVWGTKRTIIDYLYTIAGSQPLLREQLIILIKKVLWLEIYCFIHACQFKSHPCIEIGLSCSGAGRIVQARNYRILDLPSRVVGACMLPQKMFDFLKADFQSSHEAPRCECLHLIKINCLALWLDESAHACTRSELRGASCEDWKSALRLRLYRNAVSCILGEILTKNKLW